MADLDSVPSDLHGPAGYRKRVGAALVARACRRAIGEALGEEATWLKWLTSASGSGSTAGSGGRRWSRG